MLILNISSELTCTTSLCIVVMVMIGFSLGLISVTTSDMKPFILSVIIMLATIPILVLGPREDHIFVDGRTVDWEAIARQEYRTVDIDGTIVEMVKNARDGKAD